MADTTGSKTASAVADLIAMARRVGDDEIVDRLERIARLLSSAEADDLPREACH